MSKVMVFQGNSSDGRDAILKPMTIPNNINSQNVQEWLLSFSHDGDVYTVVEVFHRVNYKIREKQLPSPPSQRYIEEVDFSIFDHEENGR